jgi:hypothetical protein
MPVTVADFTTSAKDGTGIFDVLMQSVQAQLLAEFTAGRITGAEYAQVYLGSLQSTMAEGVQLVLGMDKVENEVLLLDAQKCKLQAEFDLITAQILKVQAETALLEQKRITEQGQTSGAAVSSDSVLGKQIQLYGAQADGFLRDAEQKAADLMMRTWNVRRTTDEATSANVDNKLQDTDVGAVVAKLMAGINA